MLEGKVSPRTGPAQRKLLRKQWLCRSGRALAHTADFSVQRLQEESPVSVGGGGPLQPNGSRAAKGRELVQSSGECRGGARRLRESCVRSSGVPGGAQRLRESCGERRGFEKSRPQKPVGASELRVAAEPGPGATAHHGRCTASTSATKGLRLWGESTCKAEEAHSLHLVSREIWQYLVKLKMHILFVFQFHP